MVTGRIGSAVGVVVIADSDDPGEGGDLRDAQARVTSAWTISADPTAASSP